MVFPIRSESDVLSIICKLVSLCNPGISLECDILIGTIHVNIILSIHSMYTYNVTCATAKKKIKKMHWNVMDDKERG